MKLLTLLDFDAYDFCVNLDCFWLLSPCCIPLPDHTRSIIMLGTFQFLKQRPEHNLAYIHSKPVVYVNNGGGRDTYISNSSGGLRSDYRPAHGNRTFYSNLRKYDQRAMPNRNASHTATMADKRDILSNTQNRFNDKFRRNNMLVKNYQNMLDARLSAPKVT